MNRRIALVFSLVLMLLAALGVVVLTKAATTVEGTIFIRADGSVEPSSAPIQRNGDIYVLTGDIASFSDGIVVERDGITLDGAGHKVQGTGGSGSLPTAYSTGINLTERSNVTIENTTVIGFATGMMVSLDYNNIVGNSLAGNGRGVYLTGAGHNNIHANNIFSDGDGIWLDSSSNNNIALNGVTATYGYGIILLNSSNYNSILGNDIANSDEGLTLRTFSSYNSIVENHVEDNYRGLEFLDSQNNTIAKNNITGSGWFNFRLARCSGNLVYENSITRSFYTLWLDSCSNNSFYHNFMGSLGVYLAPSTGSNAWDDGYPSGGNYWAGSNVTDQLSGVHQNSAGSDGISDAALVLNGNNTERYPLAGPFYSLNATSQYHVEIISNSTISSFEFNGTTIRFDVEVEDFANGFSRICIPTAVLNGTYTVSANGIQVPYIIIPQPDETLNYLYVAYNSSAQQVTILPELAPLWIIPVLLTALTVIIAGMTRRSTRIFKKY